MKLFSVDTNAKTIKGQKRGYMTGIMYLAPFKEAGRGNLCPHASKGCAESCLFGAGRGRFSRVRDARINRTHFYFNDNQGFFEQLVKEIEALIRKAERNGMIPAVRLNGTSDIDFTKKRFKYNEKRVTIFEVFPELTFYDYTKSIKRALSNLPSNYSLVFSRSERNEDSIRDIIRNTDVNVAVVFRNKLPKMYMGRDVIDADKDDLRFLDPKGVICGLKAKGDAKKDYSGFVVDID